MRLLPIFVLVLSAALSVSSTIGALVRVIGMAPQIDVQTFRSTFVVANVLVEGVCGFLAGIAIILQAAGVDPSAVEAVLKALLAR